MLEETQSIPGSHPSFTRTLFLDELPSLDLRFLAPLFEKISETVREERQKRRQGEGFAEVFKWRLVSSGLLAENVVASSPTWTSLSANVTSSKTEVVKESRRVGWSPPGTLDDDEDIFYDAQDNFETPIPELPPIPLVSTILLVLLRFPHIILLLFVLCIPFWSAYLVEGRLWSLLLESGRVEEPDKEGEVGYEEVSFQMNQ